MGDASPHPRRIGRYEIVDALAHGGMAELFVARLPGIEGFAKRVVIKRVLPALARDREFAEMFVGEARLAATLDHQNIVQVHDIGQDGDGYFFAMELLHGADVGNLLRTTQGIPLAIALEVARSACAGLHYAHERLGPTGVGLGLVHRDVSPQNIFVTFDGAVKLLDWGIAKAVQRISNHYTRSGTLRGKIPYMSPEQCRGEDLDRRSDVFSLAVVLWEMTVGERLFGARNESDFDVLKQIIERDAPLPSSRAQRYPAELERIVVKGLRRDPRERYASADALQVELEAFMRATAMWVTTRDLAAYMTATYPERAAELRRVPEEPLAGARQGQIVPFPGRATAVAPAQPATADLPIERQLAGARPATADLPIEREVAAARMPGPAARSPEAAPATAPPPVPRRGRAIAIGAAAVAALVGAIAIGFAFGRTRSPDAAAPAPGSGASPPASAPAPVPGAPVTEDDHGLQSDDYIISKRPYAGERVLHLHVAKALRAPARSGAPGLFLEAGGDELETGSWWRTRIAVPDELSIGRLAFCPSDGYARGKLPAERREVRLVSWIVGKITDVSRLPAEVSIGPTPCDAGAIRVARE